uniref:Uncharacterized protein n=1 Tax=Trichogramma kaykai TaxID=54128 RepID=A0ABD2WQ20_9HYME
MNWPSPRIRPSIRSSLSSKDPVANSAGDGSLASFSLQCKGATIIFCVTAFTVVQGDIHGNESEPRLTRLGVPGLSPDVCPCGLCSPSFTADVMPRVTRAFGVRTTARGKHSHQHARLTPTALYAGKPTAERKKALLQLYTHSYRVAHTCTDAARQTTHLAHTQTLWHYV